MKDEPTMPVIGFGWYKDEKHYLRLLEVSDDRSEIEDTYSHWLKFAENRFKELGRQNFFAVKIDVDIDELVAFCREGNRKVDAHSRAEFINKKIRERFGDEYFSNK